MVKHVKSKHIDLYQYPKQSDLHLGSITLGDLHGNAVKLLHGLLRYQFYQFRIGTGEEKALYNQFVHVYEKCGELLMFRHLLALLKRDLKEGIDQSGKPVDKIAYQTEMTRLEGLSGSEQFKEVYKQFEDCLCQIEEDKPGVVRLMGGVVAAQGNNDYFTLKLLAILAEHPGRLRILLSLQDGQFMKDFLDPECLERLLTEKPGSLSGLKVFISEGIVDESIVNTLIETIYKPALKVLDYSLNDAGITLYTHSPNRLSQVRALSEYFKIPYEDSTKEALAKTIDRINESFSENVSKGKLGVLCFGSEANPLKEMLSHHWSEEQDTPDARPSSQKGYHIDYVHGNDEYHSLFTNVFNLNCYSGRGSRLEVEKAIERAKKELNHRETSQKAQSLIDYFREIELNSDEWGLEDNLAHQKSQDVPENILAKIKAWFNKKMQSDPLEEDEGQDRVLSIESMMDSGSASTMFMLSRMSQEVASPEIQIVEKEDIKLDEENPPPSETTENAPKNK